MIFRSTKNTILLTMTAANPVRWRMSGGKGVDGMGWGREKGGVDGAWKKAGGLTVRLVHPCVHDVRLAVIHDVAHAEAVPVAQEPHHLLSCAAAADLEADGLARGLDVQEAGEPICLQLGGARRRTVF